MEERRLHSLISSLNFRHDISALLWWQRRERRTARTENMIKDSPMWEKMDF